MARLRLKLCDRFHALPSQIAAEDVGVIRLIKLVELGDPEGGEN